MNILVIGGAGYIGSHVCKALAAKGHVPITYDDLSRGNRWAVKWGPLLEGDIADAVRLRAALEQYRPAALFSAPMWASRSKNRYSTTATISPPPRRSCTHSLSLDAFPWCSRRAAPS